MTKNYSLVDKRATLISWPEMSNHISQGFNIKVIYHRNMSNHISPGFNIKLIYHNLFCKAGLLDHSCTPCPLYRGHNHKIILNLNQISTCEPLKTCSPRVLTLHFRVLDFSAEFRLPSSNHFNLGKSINTGQMTTAVQSLVGPTHNWNGPDHFGVCGKKTP